MSFLTVSTHQITLAAILPRVGAGMTAEALAAATGFPIDLVRDELRAMVQAGQAALSAETGAYVAAGDSHE